MPVWPGLASKKLGGGDLQCNNIIMSLLRLTPHASHPPRYIQSTVEDALSRLITHDREGWTPRHLLLSGARGSGKKTAAGLIKRALECVSVHSILKTVDDLDVCKDQGTNQDVWAQAERSAHLHQQVWIFTGSKEALCTAAAKLHFKRQPQALDLDNLSVELLAHIVVENLGARGYSLSLEHGRVLPAKHGAGAVALATHVLELSVPAYVTVFEIRLLLSLQNLMNKI